MFIAAKDRKDLLLAFGNLTTALPSCSKPKIGIHTIDIKRILY